MRSSGRQKLALAGLALLFAWVLVHAAWVSEDAYIILRTVDNFLHGHGLRWNAVERVQSYTGPLWTLLLAACSAVTREYYFTTVAVSLACSGAALALLAAGVARSPLAALAALAALVSSKAFVDYTTSGLETPLGYLLLAVFVWRVLAAESGGRKLRELALIAALAACNRMDHVLLYVPALAYAGWQVRRAGASWLGIGAGVLAGFLPFIAWEVFSLIYYGFPFPNTAYAKLHTGIPARKLVYRGLLYGLDSLERDPVTAGVALLALLLVLARRDARRLALGAGLLLYLAYTVRIGGDFMSGRFFALPFFGACLLLASLPPSRAAAATLAPACLLLGLLAEQPTLFYNAGSENKNRPRYIADERGYYYQWSGMFPVIRNGGEPRGGWVEAGRQARAEGRRVLVGESIGYLGFYAGPAVHVVDQLALCDPLLARMEVPDKNHWRIGHFKRNLPAGYVETLEGGANRIANPRLAGLYDVLEVITRGPLWRRDRFREIVKINLGFYRDRMRETGGSGPWQ